MTEMHDVVEMLLNRIKDYPEDFVREPTPKNLYDGYAGRSKWYEALQIAREVMTDEEKAAVNAAGEEAKRAIYMGAALKTIMSEEAQEQDDLLTYKSSGRYAVQGMQGPTTLINAAGNLGIGIANTMSNTAANSIQIGNAQLTEDKINMITEIAKRQKEAEERMKQAQLSPDEYRNAINNT